MAKNKKLYKVNEGKMIDGVCAGIAEYFDADPTVIMDIILCNGWKWNSCLYYLHDCISKRGCRVH